MRKLSKEIDRDRAEIARKLSPSLATQKGLKNVRESLETKDLDSGKSYQQKRLRKKVTMSGTSQDYSFDSKDGFKDYKSVVLTLDYKSHTAIYGDMTGSNKFTLTAQSSVSGLSIIVLLRGE